MAEYSIGEVERLTGIKAHVLRYWEETIPLIRPRKDSEGRRFYGSRDVQLIERVKYLVQQKKYTIGGAGERLLAELTEPGLRQTQDAIEDLRAKLTELYGIARKWKERNI